MYLLLVPDCSWKQCTDVRTRSFSDVRVRVLQRRCAVRVISCARSRQSTAVESEWQKKLRTNEQHSNLRKERLRIHTCYLYVWYATFNGNSNVSAVSSIVYSEYHMYTPVQQYSVVLGTYDVLHTILVIYLCTKVYHVRSTKYLIGSRGDYPRSLFCLPCTGLFIYVLSVHSSVHIYLVSLFFFLPRTTTTPCESYCCCVYPTDLSYG